MGIYITEPTPARIAQDVQHLKAWISKEPHLPKIDDEKWLETFLYDNKFSLEKTKFKLENYYSLRTKYPEVLKNRDPTSPEMAQCRKCVKMAVFDKLANDTWIMYVKFEPNASAFDMAAYSKRTHMIMDMMILKKEYRTTEVTLIMDFRDFRYLHALKFLAGVARLSDIANGAYSERAKAFHLVNFPAFAAKSLELTRSYYSKKFNERTHVHTETSTLHDMVDRKVLCSDLGGEGPSLAELEERTQQELEKHRKWFEEQESVCSDESLRRRDFGQAEEMRGSFRKLEVD